MTSSCSCVLSLHVPEDIRTIHTNGLLAASLPPSLSPHFFFYTSLFLKECVTIYSFNFHSSMQNEHSLNFKRKIRPFTLIRFPLDVTYNNLRTAEICKVK